MHSHPRHLTLRLLPRVLCLAGCLLLTACGTRGQLTLPPKASVVPLVLAAVDIQTAADDSSPPPAATLQ
jgi:predicted small lipoprotein YifL